MILYFRESKNEFPAWLKRLLGVNRFIIVSLIAFLLLSPLLRLINRHTEKPIVVIAQDNSQSLVMGEDSSYYRQDYKQQLNSLLNELSDDYELRLFTFGDEVNYHEGPAFDTLTYHERQTDIASLFDMMDVRFANRNTGALIIASDGIYNKGINPRYHFSALSYPIYTIALGDTAIRRDAFFKRVLYNRIAFQGNDFPVEIILNANKLSGSTLNLSIYEGKSLIDRRQEAVTSDNFSKTLRLNINAGEPGMHHYVLRVSSNKEEVSLENNRYDLFVDVLQSKQKVLILSNSPHPDVSALKEAISSNINYEVEDFLISDYNGALQDYSLIILHQLPSLSPPSARFINRMNRAEVPVLYIIGQQTDLSTYNAQMTGIVVTPYNHKGVNEALPIVAGDFTIFTMSDDFKDIISFLPPLNVPFASYNTINSGGVLLYQKLGSIESTDPLWYLDRGRKTKTGVIFGTGIWKWRMKSWMETESHTAFNELINKSVQFLAVKEDKRRFRIVTPENIPENKLVEFKAELYNESYEPFNEPDVNLEIKDEEGRSYDYVFSKSASAYTLNAGNFPVGTYIYSASARIGERVFTDDGGFTVSPVVAEQVSLRAEHELLYHLAEENGGSMLLPEEMNSLNQMLKERGDIRSLIHSEKKFVEFIDIWWILIVIMLLLGVEWFLRKWSGSY